MKVRRTGSWPLELKEKGRREREIEVSPLRRKISKRETVSDNDIRFGFCGRICIPRNIYHVYVCRVCANRSIYRCTSWQRYDNTSNVASRYITVMWQVLHNASYIIYKWIEQRSKRNQEALRKERFRGENPQSFSLETNEGDGFKIFSSFRRDRYFLEVIYKLSRTYQTTFRLRIIRSDYTSFLSHIYEEIIFN